MTIWRHTGARPRRRMVVVVVAATLLSLAAMIATDEAVVAGIATLVSIAVALGLTGRRGVPAGRALS